MPRSVRPYRFQDLTAQATAYLWAGDGPWTVALDSGLPQATFAKAVLGRLGDDVYLFGSRIESAGTLGGVWRRRAGVWTKLGNPSVAQDYNQFACYGAAAYKGKLWIGDRHGGNLYRLDMTGDALDDVRTATTIGAEDVFPGPIVWGQLILGTFGNPSPANGTVALNPEVYAWDGVSAHRVLRTDVGTGGQILSIVPYVGLLWVSASGPNGASVWTIGPYGKTTKVYSGAGLRLAVWRGDLIGLSRTEPGVLYVWRDGWLEATGQSVSHGTGDWDLLMPFGEDLLFGHQYGGLVRVRDGETSGYGLGAWAEVDPGAPESVVVHDGSLVVATNQPPRVYTRRIGAERFDKAPSIGLGGSAAVAVNDTLAAFSPNVVHDVLHWWHGDDLPAAGGISSWTNRMGGPSATQLVALNQPTVATVGGKKVARFDGINDFLTTTALDFRHTKAITIYAVIGTNGVAQPLFSGARFGVLAGFGQADPGTLTDGWEVARYNGAISGGNVPDSVFARHRGTAESSIGSTRALASGLQMVTIVLDKNRPDPEILLYVNDTSTYVVEAAGDNANYFGNLALAIGCRLSVSSFFIAIDLRHLAICAGHHDTKTRQKIQQWFATDSGFVLA